MMGLTNRRSFVSGLAGTIVAIGVSPACATSKRRIGALFSVAATDPEGVARRDAFRDGLAALGWIDGQNIEIDWRHASGSLDRQLVEATTMLAGEPEVVLAAATTALAALSRSTTIVPIVFAQVTDPIGAGFVKSLANPGGNITGVTQHEFSIGAKWLELAGQIVPNLARLGVLFDPNNPATKGYLEAIEQAALGLAVSVVPLPVTLRSEVAPTIDGFASGTPSAIVLLPGPIGAVNRDIIVARTLALKLPIVTPFRYHVVSGALCSYGADNIDLYRQAAWHVDRILKGDKPADLPVQHASRFQLIVNRKTATALGLTLPPSILIRADEVIE